MNSFFSIGTSKTSATTRLQAQPAASSSQSKKNDSDRPIHYKSQYQVIRHLVSQGGMSALYAGLWASLTQTVTSNFCYFLWYSYLKKLHSKMLRGRTASTAAELFIGALAGALSRTMTTPISVLTTRQQTSSLTSNIIQLASTILKTEGLFAFWSGYTASLVLTINPAITYGLFERVKSKMMQMKSSRLGQTRNVSWGSREIFVVGAITKAMATILTYPYIYAKIQMQLKPELEQSFKSKEKSCKLEVHDDQQHQHKKAVKKYSGPIQVLECTMKEEGVCGWYKGLSAQLTKAVLCQGILFVSKDACSQFIIALIAFYRRFK